MKKLFEKIRHNHMLLMLVCCAVPIAIVYAGIYFLRWSNNLLIWSILLLCPITHIFMMKDHGKHGGEHSDHELSKSEKEDAPK